MRFDVFGWADNISSPFLRRKLLDLVFSWGIPFNLGLGIRLIEINSDKVIVASKKNWKRRNHVGGAHACFLALMGEYPAGLLIAKNFSNTQFRIIISELHVEYFKQARGDITSQAFKPSHWPKEVTSETWIDMSAEIYSSEQELIAKVRTKWQVKPWSEVRSPK